MSVHTQIDALPRMEDAPVVRRDTFGAKRLLGAMRSPLVSQVARTEVVSRLKDVSFLGAIDHSPWARGTGAYLTSRFDHSVGVAYLAELAASRFELNERQRNLAVAAGLLHDIGHGPLSHSLEADFEKEFGINHHGMTEELLTGASARARTLRRVLGEFGVDAGEVLLLIEGQLNHPLAVLFGGPINFDTIEGVLRTANYGPKPVIQLAGLTVVEAALDIVNGNHSMVALRTLDQFWQLKGLMYTQLVRGGIGVVSDFKCHQYFQENKDRIDPAQFGWSDTAFKQKHPELFVWLENESCTSEAHSCFAHIDYVRRTFSVSPEQSKHQDPASILRSRYQQKKAPATYTWLCSAHHRLEGDNECNQATTRFSDARSTAKTR